jgi:pentatricopeptide repeat protein
VDESKKKERERVWSDHTTVQDRLPPHFHEYNSTMRIRHSTLASLLPLISLSPSSCGGFSASNASPRLVEDAVVRDVSAKVRGDKNPAPLNTRQKSFSQRDPIISLNMNLDFLAKSGQKDAAIRCEEMLLRIEALHNDGYYEKSPDVVSYNSVINAYAQGKYARSSRSGNAKRLMKLMREKGVKPNSITWNTLLRCILKEIVEKPSKEKVEEAESIISDMEEAAIANTISYNTVISIVSKSGMNDSPRRAERWLQLMLKTDKIQPDTCSFNSVIHAYANFGKNTLGAPDRARRAEDLIRQMERLHKSGDGNVKPDVVSYSAVVNAYSKAAPEDISCATRAMEILQRMEELYEGGDKDVKPNLRTYTSVINAFARIGAPEVADDLLSKMKKSHESGDISLKPDTVCYSSVLDAYAKKGGEECALRAEELLNEMIGLYNSGDNDVKPNTQTYRSVISALGRSKQARAAERAEQILEEMIYVSSQGARDLAPNTIVYNAVIDAFARSTSVSKAYRAELLLERMLEETEKGDLSVRPDTITFNSVINAAARSSFGDAIVRKEAFSIGLNAFRHVHNLDYCRPSSVTYVSYLNLLENLVESSENRDSVAERVYILCHSFGLSNDAVKAQLRRTCTPLIAQRILSSCDDTTER